jgi:hypothetical protein
MLGVFRQSELNTVGDERRPLNDSIKVSNFIIGAQDLNGALGQLANMKRGCRTQPLSRVI